ncbi:hypothetical protein FPV67DRAFT_1043325 [Lyophyllum atratum]|nr:hypothetical protein FPV67DRAFT_1043325 [Lyophyllum atratum]
MNRHVSTPPRVVQILASTTLHQEHQLRLGLLVLFQHEDRRPSVPKENRRKEETDLLVPSLSIAPKYLDLQIVFSGEVVGPLGIRIDLAMPVRPCTETRVVQWLCSKWHQGPFSLAASGLPVYHFDSTNGSRVTRCILSVVFPSSVIGAHRAGYAVRLAQPWKQKGHSIDSQVIKKIHHVSLLRFLCLSLRWDFDEYIYLVPGPMTGTEYQAVVTLQ